MLFFFIKFEVQITQLFTIHKILFYLYFRHVTYHTEGITFAIRQKADSQNLI